MAWNTAAFQQHNFFIIYLICCLGASVYLIYLHIVWKDLKECMLSEAISVCGETKGISQDIKRPGGGMMKWQPWCRKGSAYLDCGRARESVSARKDAGERKGVGVEIASVGKRLVFWAILKM